MPEPPSTPRPHRLSPRARRRLGWALAPVLALAGIGVHWLADVPKAEMLQREDKPPKSRARKRGLHPRNDAQLARLRRAWAKRPIEDEPVDQSYRRRHEALLRGVVSRARAEVLDGAKATPIQIRPTCHTIRCALELCGPKDMLAGIAELLPGFTADGLELWHELREVEPTLDPPDRKAMADYVCRRWIVGFQREDVNTRDLEAPPYD